MLPYHFLIGDHVINQHPAWRHRYTSQCSTYYNRLHDNLSWGKQLSCCIEGMRLHLLSLPGLWRYCDLKTYCNHNMAFCSIRQSNTENRVPYKGVPLGSAPSATVKQMQNWLYSKDDRYLGQQSLKSTSQ